MRLPATLDLAEREEDVATQVVEARQLGHEVMALGDLLRPLEQLEGAGQSFGNAQTLR
jgi:hypothetical protein